MKLCSNCENGAHIMMSERMVKDHYEIMSAVVCSNYLCHARTKVSFGPEAKRDAVHNWNERDLVFE